MSILAAKLQREQLLDICTDLGLSSTGSKIELISSISTFVKAAVIPRSIVAIDIGYSNLGYVHLGLTNNKINILDWARVNTNVSRTYNVYEYSLKCRELLDGGLLKPDASVYLLEKQSWRKVIPHSILRSTAVESILMGQLMVANRDLKVESVTPQLVAKYHSIGLYGANEGYRKKKSESVVLVQQWLQNRYIECPPAFQGMFEKSSKKDDLSDCLLLGVAYLEWLQNGIKYQNTIKFS